MFASMIEVGGDLQKGFTVGLSTDAGEGDWHKLGVFLSLLHGEGLVINRGSLHFTPYLIEATPQLVAQLDSALPTRDGFHDWLLGRLSS